MKFKELTRLFEAAFDPSDYNTIPAKKEVTLIVGRFQPFHNGHASLIKQAKYPIIIGLVKGKKSSEDKVKNPLDFDLQKNVIDKAKISQILDVVKVESAFIPSIISMLRDEGYEVKEVMAGTDRINSYRGMIKTYGPKINAPNVIVKELVRNDDDEGIAGISATKVRNAIKAGDFDTAKKMMLNLDQSLFKKLQKALK